MEKKIEQYLPLYLGQKFRFKVNGAKKWTSLSNSGMTAMDVHKITMNEDSFEVQLLLRPLSSMTEEEAKELDWDQRIGWPDRWDGIGRPQVITPLEFLQLLSKGFDIFNLEASGLAIYEMNDKPETV